MLFQRTSKEEKRLQRSGLYILSCQHQKQHPSVKDLHQSSHLQKGEKKKKKAECQSC